VDVGMVNCGCAFKVSWEPAVHCGLSCCLATALWISSSSELLQGDRYVLAFRKYGQLDAAGIGSPALRENGT